MHKGGREKIPNDFLIAKLKEAYAILGRTPKYREIKNDKRFPSPSVYEKHFGSWRKALMACGITPPDVNPGPKAKGTIAAKEWGRRMALINTKTVLDKPFANLRMRFEVFNRDNFTCQYCGRTPQDGAKLVLDHRLAVANGGETKIDNLITSCFECNAGKSNLLLNEHKKKS